MVDNLSEMTHKVIEVNPNLNEDTVKEVCKILIEQGYRRELSFKEIRTLRLITVAATCYADIIRQLSEQMSEKSELVELYIKTPQVQGTINRLALDNLASSQFDVNSITSLQQILDLMPGFKAQLENYRLAAEPSTAEQLGILGG